jgi:hypothetical protein
MAINVFPMANALNFYDSWLEQQFVNDESPTRIRYVCSTPVSFTEPRGVG